MIFAQLLSPRNSLARMKNLAVSLKDKPLIGGWQETLQQSVYENEGKTFLKGIELSFPSKRRQQHHLFVSDKRDIAAMCSDVIDSLNEFLTQRFSLDSDIAKQLHDFVHFNQEKVDVRAVHTAICSDLDLTAVSIEYQELASNKDFTSLKLADMVRWLTAANDSYKNVCIMLARILAAKPHSADVERCISANNLLKTSLRSALSLHTEAMYMFVHHNLPPVADWDATISVTHWLEKPRRYVIPVKAKQQAYFKNFFAQAGIVQTDSDSTTDLTEPAVKKRRNF
jgi:hypothetical protein